MTRDEQAALLHEHEPLLKRIARYFSADGKVEYDDMLQEARLGFLEAAPSYDPERGSIALYARRRASGACRDYRLGTIGAVRRPLPRSASRRATYKTEWADCAFGRVVAVAQPASMDMSVTEDPKGTPLVEVLHGGEADAGEAVAHNQMVVAVNLALARLPDREARAMAIRFGDEDTTWRAIAATLGISTTGAQKVYGRAAGRLRELLVEHAPEGRMAA